MVIEVENLSKTFRYRGGQIEAVRGIDLQIRERGQVFSLLGPNGAGKTTTVRILATLMAPDSGRVRVLGCELPRETEKARRHLGYVSQAGGVDDGMPVRDNLLLQARLCRMGRKEAIESTERLLDTLGLEDVAHRIGRTLSGGQRRRAALAIGLVHRPTLLFLDEPTLGLDPAARAMLWEEVRTLRASGTTVFLTTHYLDEADALCDRVAIVDQGRIVADGAPATLKREISGDVITVDVAEDDRDRAKVELAAFPLTNEVRAEPGALRAYVGNGADAIPELVRRLQDKGIAVRSVGLESASLDDVFLRQTGHSLRTAPAPVAPHSSGA